MEKNSRCRWRLRALLLFSLLPTLGADCQWEPAAPPDDSPSGYRAAWIDSLLAAEDTAVVDGIPLALSASAGRNFFPSHPPVDHSLTVGVTVSSTAKGGVPAGFDVDRLVAILGDEVWVRELPADGRANDPKKISESAGSGPGWPCGSTIDVAVSLRSPRGDLRYLRATARISCAY